MAKDHPVFIEERKALRRIIKLYENENWSKTSKISNEQIELSDRAEAKAEQFHLARVTLPFYTAYSESS